MSSLPRRAVAPRVTLVACSLAAGTGGIPRVARLILHTLETLSQSGWFTLECLTLDQFLVGKSQWARQVARLRMLIAHRRLSRRCSHFIYDSCQMTQLHFRPSQLATPALTFIHGIEVWEHGKPGYIAACKKSHLLVANSNYTRQRAHQLHGDFDRSQVCWLATESEALPHPTATLPPPSVLIVSRIDQQEGYKGHIELIEAWPNVVRVVPHAILRIVGRGSGLADLQQRVADLPCKNNIVFEGFVPDENLEAIYQNSTVFAMPSRGEGFGIVYIEAMRCGLPVITSRQDAGQEVIVDGQTGFAVDLESPTQLSDRLIQLLTNPTLARQLGQAGQARWQEHFTPSRFVERFSPYVHQLLSLPAVGAK